MINTTNILRWMCLQSEFFLLFRQCSLAIGCLLYRWTGSWPEPQNAWIRCVSWPVDSGTITCECFRDWNINISFPGDSISFTLIELKNEYSIPQCHICQVKTPLNSFFSCHYHSCVCKPDTDIWGELPIKQYQILLLAENKSNVCTCLEVQCLILSNNLHESNSYPPI